MKKTVPYMNKPENMAEAMVMLSEQEQEIVRLRKWNKWFFYRVKFMRQCQKEYFRLRKECRNQKLEEAERDIAALNAKEYQLKSMTLEKEVDVEIMRVTSVLTRQEAIAELDKDPGELDDVKIEESQMNDKK